MRGSNGAVLRHACVLVTVLPLRVACLVLTTRVVIIVELLELALLSCWCIS